jgi:hypothetical protein
LRENLQRFKTLVEYLFDFENGCITLSHTEYFTLPAVLTSARRIFRSELADYRKKQADGAGH